MTLARTTAGINKAEDAETAHGQINPPMRCSELSDDGVRLSPIAGFGSAKRSCTAEVQ